MPQRSQEYATPSPYDESYEVSVFDDATAYEMYFADLKARGSDKYLTKQDELNLWQEYFSAKEIIESLTTRSIQGELPAEQIEQLECAKQQLSRATRIFVDKNLFWVAKIAKKFGTNFLEFLDLVQEGNLGLMHAIEIFDLSLNARLNTYATWWITRYIQIAIEKNEKLIREPRRFLEFQRAYARAVETLSHRLHANRQPGQPVESPSLEAIAEYMNIPLPSLKYLLQTRTSVISFTDLETEDSEESFDEGHMLADPNANTEANVLRAENTHRAKALFEQITTRLNLTEQIILTMRYGIVGHLTPLSVKKYFSPKNIPLTEQQIDQLMAWEPGQTWSAERTSIFLGFSRQNVGVIERKVRRMIETRFRLPGKELVENLKD